MAHIERYINDRFKYRTFKQPVQIIQTKPDINKEVEKTIGLGFEENKNIEQKIKVPEIQEVVKQNLNLKEYYLPDGKKGRRKKLSITTTEPNKFDGRFQF